MTDQKNGIDDVDPVAYSEGDRILAAVNGGVVEGGWQTMRQLGKEILAEAEEHKTGLERAKEMGAGVHIRVSCKNCGLTHEAEYVRQLAETPEGHVEYPDDDCTLEDVEVEAFCPRHGTVPLEYDGCDTCLSEQAVMNR